MIALLLLSTRLCSHRGTAAGGEVCLYISLQERRWQNDEEDDDDGCGYMCIFEL
jgi:hypothetical protein